ncbi:probable G-protein coupled receptor 82 [Brienomyrus brachyistius]|uniref:probable G-protein coupled receptor 82 n=1 Tax=Brienomyrus brachyistius TaxID=42636 RepID=UPI0020B3B848|nr:probable G-protein coupled receptor 82 [Brienomyrus brachyistius]
MTSAQWSVENGSKHREDCFPAADGSCLCTSPATRLVLPVLYTFMLLMGLTGNAWSLWIFTKMIHTKSSTHIYLISLGVSNLLLCLTMPFQAAYFAAGASWRVSDPACRLAIGLVTPVLHINIYVGMFTLTWIGLSRCALLLQHDLGGRSSTCTSVLPPSFFHRLRQASFAKVSCVVTWTVVIAAVLPVVIYYSVQEATALDRTQVCYSLPVEVGGGGSRGAAVVALVFFYICFLLVLASYSAVSRYFIRSRRNTVILEKHQVYARVLRNIVVIQFVLTVCLLPHHIFKAVFINQVRQAAQLVTDGCHSLSWLVEVKNLLTCLAVLRCSIDPIIYFLLDKTFRKYAMGMLNTSVTSQVPLPAIQSFPSVAQNRSCGRDNQCVQAMTQESPMV